MKRLITICLVVGMMLAVSGTAQAALWEIQDAGLGDTTNFVNTIYGTNGNLNSRTDITGNPGYQFNITLTNDLGGWTDIAIGDNFDLPTSLAGLASATGNGGNLSGYTGYRMYIENPGSDSFWASLYMNTGWTDPPWHLTEGDHYYQSGNGQGVWVGAGSTVALTIDFTAGNAAWWDGSGWITGQTVQHLNHVTDIGFKIGAQLNTAGQVSSGHAFNVNVVPEPATIAMLGLGALGFIRGRRRQGK